MLDYIFFVVLSLIALYLIWFVVAQRLEGRKYQGYPTVPGGLPIIGHALQMSQGKPWEVMQRWYDHYGPVSRFYFFNENYITISEPDIIKHVFSTNINNFKKDLHRSYGPFMCLLGDGLVTSHGEQWRKQRSLTGSVFRVEILGDIVRVTASAADLLSKKLMDSIEAHGSSSSSAGGDFGGRQVAKIEMGEEFRMLTLQVIGKTVLGLSADESDRVFPSLYLPIVTEANARVWYPWRAYFPSAANRRYHSCIKALNQYVSDIIVKRWKQVESGVVKEERDKDILDRIIAGQTEERCERLVNQLRDEVKTFVFAGHETSSMMLTWACWELTQHPECLEKVLSEAQEMFGDEGKRLGGDLPPLKSLKKGLVYTENVLKETLRKWSVVPAVTRETVEDDHVNGVTFPKGSRVVVAIKVVHNRKDLWGDPERFRPERFEKKLPHRYAFLPFIQGVRNCLGEQFALLEGKILLALFVLRFSFKPAPETTDERHPFMIPVCPRNGLKLILSKRE